MLQYLSWNILISAAFYNVFFETLHRNEEKCLNSKRRKLARKIFLFPLHSNLKRPVVSYVSIKIPVSFGTNIN